MQHEMCATNCIPGSSAEKVTPCWRSTRTTRYDGHGLLWYFLGRPLTSGSPTNPAAIQVFHLMLATATAYIIARFSPFSRVQKILIVLGYLFVYEYRNHRSRGYAIGALFLVTFCAVAYTTPAGLFMELV